jgi:hypothetical protein
LQTSALPFGGLSIEQKGKPFGMAELLGLGIVRHLGEGGGHAGETEFAELVDGGVWEHVI